MSGRRGRRRGPARSGDPVRTALDAWREHTKHCHRCHAAAGHPALYCGEGWLLASEVSKARTAVRVANEVRARNRGVMW